MNTENKGKRVKLISMEDPNPVPTGTLGTVEFEDGIGQIHVKWDNGSSLALIPDVDKFEYVTESNRIKRFDQFK